MSDTTILELNSTISSDSKNLDKIRENFLKTFYQLTDFFTKKEYNYRKKKIRIYFVFEGGFGKIY